MILQVRSLIYFYMGLFAFVILAAGVAQAVLIFAGDIPADSRTALIEFCVSMKDLVEVAFGALIGALSASLQRAFDPNSSPPAVVVPTLPSRRSREEAALPAGGV